METGIWLYTNLDKKNGKILQDVDWSRKTNKNFSNLHSISYYLAMFCPALPEYFIKKYSKEKDIIMDNFSGRGTTALVARETNRKFIGNDLNPYAFVISKLKISKFSLEEIFKEIDLWEKKFISDKNNYLNEVIKSDYKDLLYIFSKETLAQLLFIKKNYGEKWFHLNDIENAILGFLLGIIHGQSKKNKETIYCSVDMPNTISMSPNYIKRYVEKNKLICPDVNVFSQIKNRILNKHQKLLRKKFNGKIYFENALNMKEKISPRTITLVVTSPPYLNIVNYTNSNWLRLWVLGYERKDLSKEIKLSDKLKFDEYVDFIKDYLNSIYFFLKKNAVVCLVVGDVEDKKLIEEVWTKIKNDVKYTFVEIYYDKNYKQNHKSTNMLNSKKGQATLIEKVLVLKKTYD